MTDEVDFAALEELYSGMRRSPCFHPDAISVDGNGVYHIHCQKCGIWGLTTAEGARTLGWIE